MTTARARARFTFLPVLALLGCGGGEAPAGEESDAGAEPAATAEAAATEAPMSVRITAPEDGARLESGNVRVTLDVEGLTVVPAGDMTPRSGHHHLILNADLPPMDAPIPVVEGQYIHLGAGQSEYELTDLAPGEYTVIALVGDFAHVPLDPPVADTVRFVVRE